MKRVCLFVVVVACMAVMVHATDLRGGKFSYGLDTLVAAESVKVPYKVWGEYLEGYGSLVFQNRLVKTAAKVKLYIEYSNDSLIWVDRILLDSLVLKDTTYYDLSSRMKGYAYWQIVAKAFMSAGESLAVQWDGYLVPRRSISR